jgi:hypothetical protein
LPTFGFTPLSHTAYSQLVCSEHRAVNILPYLLP